MRKRTLIKTKKKKSHSPQYKRVSSTHFGFYVKKKEEKGLTAMSSFPSYPNFFFHQACIRCEVLSPFSRIAKELNMEMRWGRGEKLPMKTPLSAVALTFSCFSRFYLVGSLSLIWSFSRSLRISYHAKDFLLLDESLVKWRVYCKMMWIARLIWFYPSHFFFHWIFRWVHVIYIFFKLNSRRYYQLSK